MQHHTAHNSNSQGFIIMPKLLHPLPSEPLHESFKAKARQRLIQQVQRVKTRYQRSGVVLVVDLLSATIISYLFKVTQLVAEGVMFIERLQVDRKPLDEHALYLISPNQQSVRHLVHDWSEEHLQYHKLHVLFTAQLDRRLMHEISQNKTLIKHLGRHSFKQFYLQLHVISQNCVHLMTPSLALSYSADSKQEENLRDAIAARFVDMVATMGKVNTVRIYYEQTHNRVAERMAKASNLFIKQYLEQLLMESGFVVDENSPDVTFLVLDRAADMITPFMHPYAYEALLEDLMPQQSHQMRPKLQGSLFEQFRYRHLSHALSVLPERLQVVSARLEKVTEMQAMEIRDLSDEKEPLSVHLTTLHRLWQKFKERSLNEIGELELSLATGVTADGKQTSSSQLLSQVINIIRKNVQLNRQELLRLAVMAVVCIKLSKSDYQALVDLFPEEDQTVIKNLSVMGVTYDHKVSRSTKNIDKAVRNMASKKLEQSSMPSERHTCTLELILPRIVESLTQGVQRGLRSEVSSTISEQRVPKFAKERTIVFMCGGLTSAQICRVRQNKALDSLVIAADSIVSPNQLLRDISRINLLDRF